MTEKKWFTSEDLVVRLQTDKGSFQGVVVHTEDTGNEARVVVDFPPSEVPTIPVGSEAPLVFSGSSLPADLKGSGTVVLRREAGRLSAVGVTVYTDTFVARQPRGAGGFAPKKMQYFGELALAELEGTDLMVFAGTTMPVAFFAYPDRPSVLVPEGCATLTLAERAEDSVTGLGALADALGAPKQGPTQSLVLPDAAPSGALNAHLIGTSIARHMPEGAIICDDAVTSGTGVAAATLSARPHDVLALTGGAIGIGLPLAIGAAVAAPDRKVLSLNGDGAAMYTVQALWTMARENLDITVVIFANHSYRILNIEMQRTGAGKAGPSARKLLDLDDPKVDWVSLAKGMRLPTVRCTTAEEFDKAFAGAMNQRGPMFIEAAM